MRLNMIWIPGTSHRSNFFFLYMSITCPYTTVNWHATWKTTSLSGSLGISQHQPGRLRCISFIWPLAYKLGKPGHRVHSGQVINQPKDSLVSWDCLPVIFGISENYPSALNLSFQHRTISVLSPTMIHFDSYQPELHWSGPLRHRTIPDHSGT